MKRKITLSNLWLVNLIIRSCCLEMAASDPLYYLEAKLYFPFYSCLVVQILRLVDSYTYSHPKFCKRPHFSRVKRKVKGLSHLNFIILISISISQKPLQISL